MVQSRAPILVSGISIQYSTQQQHSKQCIFGHGALPTAHSSKAGISTFFCVWTSDSCHHSHSGRACQASGAAPPIPIAAYQLNAELRTAVLLPKGSYAHDIYSRRADDSYSQQSKATLTRMWECFSSQTTCK